MWRKTRAVTPFTTALVLLLFASLQAGAQPPASDTWVKAETPRISVYSNGRAAKTRELLLAMEQLGAVMSNFGEPYEEPEPPTVVLAFDRSRDMEAYLSSPSGKGVTTMVEYGIGAHGTMMVMNASAVADEVLPWAYRAQLGQDIVRRYPRLSLWARTGLTHFYATMQVEKNGKVRIGRPDAGHLRRLRDYSWIPFEQLFRLDRRSLRQGDVVSQFQAQSWVLTHYVMTGGGGDPSLGGKFYGALGLGLAPEEAIRAVFGLGISDFQTQLQRYARGLTLKYFTIEIPNLPEGGYDVTPVEHEEILLRLGQYLTRTIKPVPVEIAEKHLLPVVDHPTFGADALMALAEVREISGRSAEARELYARGLAAEPREARSYYAYARFLGENGEALEERRTLLEKTVALAPWMGDAWGRLALTYHASDPGAAVEHLRRALRLDPDRTDLARNLVTAHLNLGEVAAARDVVARLLVGAERSRERSSAESDIARFETTARHNAEVDAFNDAVAMINDGQREEGRRLLQELLAETDDEKIREAITRTILQLGSRD
jgi:tetratricopeptide (TPR) repeat protein